MADLGKESINYLKVTAAVIFDGSQVLVAKRPAGKHLAGKWEFPGGKIEDAETPESCLARELLEELNINARVGRFIGESIYDYGEKCVKLMAYEVREYAGDIVLSEHAEVAWVAPAELHTVDLAPADIPLIDRVQFWFSK